MLKSTHKSAASGATDSPLPEGWTEHTAPSGHKYYHNASTKQSTYTRPDPTPTESEELLIDFNATAPDATLHATAQALDEFHRNRDPRGPNHFRGGQAYQDRPRRGHGGDRPKSKTVIPGAEPWVLVRTKYARRFVHNTETKQSLWKFPQEVMMAVIEMERKEWEEKKKKAEKEKEDAKDPAKAKGRDAVARANAMHRQQEEQEVAEEGESSDYEEVEVTDDEGEGEDGTSKRQRLEPIAPSPPPGPVELNEDDIDWQLAQMEDADEYNDEYNEEEEEGLPITEEDNIALFRSLLDDYAISPYTTFEKVIENNDILEDTRYIALPNMHARRDVFTEWSRDRIAEIHEHQALEASVTKQVDPKVTYLRFLQRYATPKLYWPEFKRKYKKEAEMKDYGVSDKERERMYRDLVAKLKLGESDRRKELLALLKGAKGDLDRNSSRKDDLPEAILKDVRFYLVDEKKRDEMVEGYLSTL